MSPGHAVKCSLTLMVVGTLGACAKAVPIVETQGECGSLFEAQVCTWARMQGDSVIDIGATIPVAGIESAPADYAMAWPPEAVAVLALPAPAQQQAGLTHLTVYWEAMGHPPGPYLTPHFDFHFYTISNDQRMAIDCGDLSKPAVLASGYSLPDVALPPPLVAMTGVDTLVGLCVPGMGMHSLLTTELESSETFRGTLVVGYYQGKHILIEPMITRAMLLERKSFDLAVPPIPGILGNQPHAFRAEYDSAQGTYRFVFSSFSPGS